MKTIKSELEIDKNCKQPVYYKQNNIPKYYQGKEGYEARKVCDNFDLSYHCGTAVTYILRAYQKHDTPIECLTKAIAHLKFEIQKYEQNNQRQKDRTL